MEDNNDGSYEVTFTPQHIGKAKLMASINGQQVKGSPYDVTVQQDYNNAYIAKLNSSDIGEDSKQPWGIAIGRCGIWAVTDYYNHCVYLFKKYTLRQPIKCQILKKLGSHGSDDGQFQNPHGIVFDNNNNLFVVDSNNHRIQKFDMRGNYLLKFGGKGAGAGQLNSPRGIALHNGRVYVADSGNKRVSVFQTTSQFCHTIGEQLLGVPCDVTVNNNVVLVAVYGQNCLNAFTLDGQSKGNFCTLRHHNSETNSNMYPYSLTTDLNGFVIVSGTCSRYIEVFGKDGNYVNSGQNSLNVKYPRSNFPQQDRRSIPPPLGVAVSPEGGIWVTSTDSSCIQNLIQEDFPTY